MLSDPFYSGHKPDIQEIPSTATRVRVLSRVAIWRVVTTKGNTTCLTSPQVDPACVDFDALFAFSTRRVFDLGNRV